MSTRRWLGLTLIALGAVLRLDAAEPRSLLSNGGFEDGFAGWEPAAGHEIAKGESVAYEGEACLTGEVTEPGKALILRRRVPVRAGYRYRLAMWARASARSKLVLWVVPPRTGQRQLEASWENVPRRWTRYEQGVDIAEDGTLELQIVAPSSFGAPTGRLWVDAISLEADELPKLLDVSKEIGFNDAPTLALADDGTAYVAWISFRDGWDSLQLARMRPEAEPVAELGRWQALGGEDTYVLHPRLVAASDRAYLLCAVEERGDWNVLVFPCGPEGPEKPARIGAGSAVDIKPVGAWVDGTLWVAWESSRQGRRQILCVSLSEGTLSDPVELSGDSGSAYAPSIAGLSSGQVAVAWHAFGGGSCDIFLRTRDPAGSWTPTRKLTEASTIDRHAALFGRGRELWIAYENATTERYNVGRTNRRRLFVARVEPEGLVAPVHGEGQTPLAGRCEAAAPAFDPSGRLWLAHLRPRPPRAGWDAVLTCYAAGAWQEPAVLSGRKGMDRAPALAIAGDVAVVAFQADTIPGSWSDVDLTDSARSDVLLAKVRLSSMPPAPQMRLEPIVEPEEPFEPAQLRIARGEDLPTPEIEYRGETLRLFFGDLHEHTDVSVCNRLGDQSIDESYQHMRDLARHDFACATDHGYNLNPYLWRYTAKLARANTDQGRFVAFLAEEWTSSFETYDAKHPYGYYGHRNLIFADPYFPRWWNARNGQTPAQVWEELRALQADFVHIPHQLADTGNVPTDWDFADETAQPVAEIFQTRGSYEHPGAPREAGGTTPTPGSFLQDAWARGIVIGVIASPDHGGGYGKACVYAPELTRRAILDALRARRCYGTTAAKIFLDVRVDGRLMGEKTSDEAPQGLAVEVTARTTDAIDRIEVCRNNEFIYVARPEGREARLTFVDRSPLPGRSYYYVRVIQKDGEIAWSSPVWFGAP